MIHIVDDNEILREMLVEMVELNGVDCLAFASGPDYLEYVGSGDFRQPAGVLTDLNMPVMNGYEMMEQVLERFPEIRFAVISGDPEEPGNRKHQACLYLLKPFHGEAIADLVEKFCRCEPGDPHRNSGCASFGHNAMFGRNEFNCPKAQDSRIS